MSMTLATFHRTHGLLHAQTTCKKTKQSTDLQEHLLCQVQVVHALVLHAHACEGQMQAREQASCRSVGSHGLITLILKGKGIAKAYPGSCKTVLYAGSLAKIPPSTVILLRAQVVAAHSKPG